MAKISSKKICKTTIHNEKLCYLQRLYIRSFNHFDAYLQTVDDAFVSSGINRAHIIGLMEFLTKKGFMPETRKITLVNLRIFHQVVLLEGWLDWPSKPLIYPSDLPRERNVTPKYISDDIIAQLKKHLSHLPLWMQNFITILWKQNDESAKYVHFIMIV